jgi:hypothetical protein
MLICVVVAFVSLCFYCVNTCITLLLIVLANCTLWCLFRKLLTICLMDACGSGCNNCFKIPSICVTSSHEYMLCEKT